MIEGVKDKMKNCVVIFNPKDRPDSSASIQTPTILVDSNSETYQVFTFSRVQTL